MSEFNYTEWMQQNKVGPYTKASLKEGGPGDEPPTTFPEDDYDDKRDLDEDEDDDARDAKANKMEDDDTEAENAETERDLDEGSESVIITIPENTDYNELAKAVAKVLIEDYGQHNYKPFLQALIAELK